jgi:hypothetical protein
MLKKDEKQIEELKEAEASRSIAREFIEKYQKGLETVQVSPQEDKEKETTIKKEGGQKEASVFCVD